MIRTGIGYDSHRFASGRPLILGGVRIEHTAGLEGHSDADVIAHALTDALLGAAALGDIGRHFPDSDPAHRGANSVTLLRIARERVGEAGWRVVSADATVILEAPRIGDQVGAMRQALAGALAVDPGAVSIKGKSNEGMGFIGRGEGVAAIAVVTVESAPAG